MSADALYVHIPFCVRRCAYCGFASSVYDPRKVDAYLRALDQEWTRRAGGLEPRTIYVGGGTPTCLSVDELDRLMGLVQGVPRSRLREFSVEANPGTLTMEKLMRLRAAGATRVSLGAQTFAEAGLRTLGRAHTAKQILAAAVLCREAGFDDLSMDLISGWPAQTLHGWDADLYCALRLEPTHLSCYDLTYEPGTPLWRAREAGRLRVVSEESARAMLDRTATFLPANGLLRYEISSYARPGRECLHNINYWEGGEYVGLGAGAHSFAGGVRSSNVASPHVYARMIKETGSARTWEESLDPERRARERAVIWLRMTEGIDIARFERETALSIDDLFGRDLAELVEAGWLERTAQRLRLSARALPVADSILAELVA